MKKGLTELVFILDKSGSMGGVTEDTIGGFNAMIEKQKAEEGEALVSTVVFADDSRVIHDRIPLAEVPALTRREYCPMGCTALIDAIGDAVHHMKNVHKYIREEDRPEHTLFVITTDGEENASRRYTSSEVKRMIQQQEERGWEFMFIGANIDSVETAEHLGIRRERTANYRSDARGENLKFAVLNKAIGSMRANGCVEACWAAELEEDMERKD